MAYCVPRFFSAKWFSIITGNKSNLLSTPLLRSLLWYRRIRLRKLTQMIRIPTKLKGGGGNWLWRHFCVTYQFLNLLLMFFTPSHSFINSWDLMSFGCLSSLAWLCFLHVTISYSLFEDISKGKACPYTLFSKAGNVLFLDMYKKLILEPSNWRQKQKRRRWLRKPQLNWIRCCVLEKHDTNTSNF